METDGIIGVCLHEVDLALELEGVGPIVVALAIGYVFAPSSGVVEVDVHLASIATSVLVLGFVKGKDEVGVLGCVLAYDVVGAVGGGIVVDEYLDGEVGLLRQDSVEAVADVVCVVLCVAADAY